MDAATIRTSLRASLGLAALWLALKVLSVFLWVLAPEEYGDTFYYFQSAEKALAGGGVGEMMREYPTPAVLLLLVPYALGGTDWGGYRDLFIVMVAVFDAAFTVLVARRAGWVAAISWISLTALAGPTVLLRFDLIPSVFAGAALLLALQGATVASAPLLALGVGFKLWPVVQSPTLLIEKTRRLPALAAFGATGLLLVMVSVLTGGWTRLVSPLGYQSERGLQIEAVAATVPMWSWLTDAAYRVEFSNFLAFEVFGPGVDGWIAIAGGAGAVSAVVVLGLVVWWFRRGTPPEAGGYLALLAVLAFMVTSKALSPQYLLWVAAPAAVLVGLAVTRPHEWSPGRATLTFLAVGVVMALTLAVYPVLYDGLWQHRDFSRLAVQALTLRNVLLLGLTVWVGWCAGTAIRRAPDRTGRSRGAGRPRGAAPASGR